MGGYSGGPGGPKRQAGESTVYGGESSGQGAAAVEGDVRAAAFGHISQFLFATLGGESRKGAVRSGGARRVDGVRGRGGER